MEDEKLVLTREDVHTFVFHREWFEDIKELPIEQQMKIVYDMCRKGTNLEPIYEDDIMVKSFVNILSRNVNSSKDAYLAKVNMSKTAGRKKKYSDEEIYNLAREGKTVTEIAYKLGCSTSTVSHSEGYRNRNNKDFIF